MLYVKKELSPPPQKKKTNIQPCIVCKLLFCFDIALPKEKSSPLQVNLHPIVWLGHTSFGTPFLKIIAYVFPLVNYNKGQQPEVNQEILGRLIQAGIRLSGPRQLAGLAKHHQHSKRTWPFLRAQ